MSDKATHTAAPAQQPVRKRSGMLGFGRKSSKGSKGGAAAGHGPLVPAVEVDGGGGGEKRKSSTGLLTKLMATKAQGRRRQWQSTVEPPRLEGLDCGAAAPSAPSPTATKRTEARRNSEELTGHAEDGVEGGVGTVGSGGSGGGGSRGGGSGGGGSGGIGSSSTKHRSAIRHFLMDSFRSKRSSSHRHSATDVAASASGTSTVREEEDLSEDSVGGLVGRLRGLTATQSSASALSSAGVPPVKGLPHPSRIPLDGRYGPPDASEKRQRKISCPQSPLTAQDRHKDLLDGITRSLTPMSSEQRQQQQQQQQQQQPSAASSSSSVSRRLRNCSSSSSTGCGDPPGHGGGSRQQLQVAENDKFIILRSKCQSESSTVDLEEVRDASQPTPGRVFEVFSQRHRCYDLIPTSSKLLVFDNNLNVKKAFFALVYNGLRAAPVWDSEQQRFVGMLTISDFISVLHMFYRSALVPMTELESHRISTWRAQLQDSLMPFLWISPEATLLEAIRLLLHAKVHRLPVVEPRTGNALFILTHKRILKYIYLYMHQLPMPDWLDVPLQRLGIGTYSGVVTVSESTPLIKVLSLFVQHRVSALPVVRPDGRMTDIYSKFDVINLAATKTYNNLEISVQEALQYRKDRFDGVTACRASDTLRCAIEKLVTAEVHRLVLTDEQQRVTGVVSLSDILKAIVLDHEKLMSRVSVEAMEMDG